MKVYFHFILFFTIFVSLSNAFIDDGLSTPFITCGLYGFRCLDNKRAQICDDKKDEVEESSKKPRIFECADGLVCDEEKVEYCSPKEGFGSKNNSCACSKANLQKRHSSKCPCRHSRSSRTGEKIADNDFEEDEPTKEKDEIDPWNGSPPINCDTHGFFPDNNNKSRFFFCDLKKEANGFVLRHMLCGQNRLFEPNFKACVLKGSTRNIRRDKKREESKIINSAENSNFSCDKKKPGKYPDEVDCHIYHICLPKKLYEPFEHLTVECPHSTAFNPLKKKCSKKYLKVQRKESELNVYCDQEIRFREVKSCDKYFLCYQDQIIEFLCPPGFKFDGSLQFCEAERYVKCD